LPKSELKRISDLLVPGDVLLIVPPMAQTDMPSLGVHLLKACCLRSGIKLIIFYANLHFCSLIGTKLYRAISNLEGLMFIGERLFARAAFNSPPLGWNVHRLIDPDWLPDHLWHKKNGITSREMLKSFAPLRQWILTVDWQHVENQASQWIKSVTEQIAGMDYRVVGCSITSGRLAPSIALLNHVKRVSPHIITVLGGALCEDEMAEGILSLDTGIDYIFPGESEIIFPSFFHDVLAGKRPKDKIIYGKEMANLDETPMPEYGEYFHQEANTISTLSHGNTIRLPYETSRGCHWGKCNFCGLNGKGKSYRIKSPSIILQELEKLTKQYPVTHIHMTDTFMPQKYFETLFPRMAEMLPSICIEYELTPNLTLDQLIALKQAGTSFIHAGIESLSSSILKRIKKCVNLRGNIAFLRYVRAVGFDIFWQILFGIPGDQICEYAEILELMPLICHLPPPFRIVPVEITRFSPYQTTPETFGISNLRPAELYIDIFPAHAHLEKIAYYFTGDFNAQSHEHPEILAALEKGLQNWQNAWRPDASNPSNFEPPMLYLERQTSGQFVLHDTRGLPGRPEKMVVDREKASVLSVSRPWDESPVLRWAIDAKLGVLRESRFIPLATAEPEIMKNFEKNL